MSGPDDDEGQDLEVLDTAAAAPLVLDDEDDEDLADDDLDAPTEAGGPPAPAGEGQDQ